MKNLVIKFTGSEISIINQLKELENAGITVNWANIAKNGFANGVVVDVFNNVCPVMDKIAITKEVNTDESLLKMLKVPKNIPDDAKGIIDDEIQRFMKDAMVGSADFDPIEAAKNIMGKVLERRNNGDTNAEIDAFKSASASIEAKFLNRYVYANGDTVSFIKKVVVDNDSMVRLYYNTDDINGYFKPSSINLIFANREITTESGYKILVGPESIYAIDLPGFFKLGTDRITQLLKGLKALKETAIIPVNYLLGGEILVTNTELEQILTNVCNARVEVEPYIADDEK